MCSIDWVIVKDILVALIGAGIPSIVAWQIFKSWREQKGSEVVANEAKRLLVDLAELISLSKKMNSNTLLDDQIQKALKSFNFQTDIIINQLDFLIEEVSSEQQEILKNLKNDLYSTNESLSKFINKSANFALTCSLMAANDASIFEELFKSNLNAEKVLRDLALYRVK